MAEGYTATDQQRLASQVDRIRDVMLDGVWRTRDEIAVATDLSVHSDITRRVRNLRYVKFGQHLVERRRRGDEERGIYEYKVHPAGTGPKPFSPAQQIKALKAALAEFDPTHPLLEI